MVHLGQEAGARAGELQLGIEQDVVVSGAFKPDLRHASNRR
jgi:hypothetical protein